MGRDTIIPQPEISAIFAQQKWLNLSAGKWLAKQSAQPAPQWVEYKLTFLDVQELPIPYLNFQIQYRPARRDFTLPSLNLIALYKNRRLFALDQGQGIAHINHFTDVEPVPPPYVSGAHYHLLHEKHNQETGYPLEIPIDKQTDISYFLTLFAQRFNTVLIGEMPHPLHQNGSQLELSL